MSLKRGGVMEQPEVMVYADIAAVGDLSPGQGCGNDTRGVGGDGERQQHQDTQQYVRRLVGYVVGLRGSKLPQNDLF